MILQSLSVSWAPSLQLIVIVELSSHFFCKNQSVVMMSRATLSFSIWLSVEPSNSNLDPYHEDQVETIGSRLRKRRRTGSSPKEKAPSTPKRANQKKPVLLESKRSQTNLAPKGNQPVTPSYSLYSTPYSSIGPFPVHQGEHATNGHQEAPAVPEPEVNGVMKGPFEVPEDATSLNASSQTQQHMPLATVSPDLAALIRNIVERGEAIDKRYGEMGYVDTESFVPLGASLHLKVQCLPILDNLVSCL